MITLYHSPRTRSSRFIFLLEELGAPYRIHSIARSEAGVGRDPANPHPHGKVPAISDDGVAVFESSAIALYLTDRFPEAGIGPVVGDPKRGAYLTWLAYYCGVMEPAWMMKFMKVELPPTMPGWPPADQVMEFVNRTLEAGPYLLGERFSAADILAGTTFAMFMGGGMVEKTPLLEGYVQRVVGRPAYARAQAREAEAEAAATT
ncbi:MAG TPA: glutathione S-transferase family protein [Caulobacteraceae bacterium]|nr:glutathione S-transferase family protein [Caulobacteraceae bacterium]